MYLFEIMWLLQGSFFSSANINIVSAELPLKMASTTNGETLENHHFLDYGRTAQKIAHKRKKN